MLYGSDQFGSDARFGNDGNTIVLLHFDGADNGTSFPDSAAGSVNHSFTAGGGAITHRTSYATPPFGNGSGKFLANGDYVSCSDAAELRIGTGDFTIDFWVRYNTGSVNHSLASKGLTAAGDWLIQTDNAASLKISFYTSGTPIVAETTASSTGVWVHKAVVRAGSTVTLYSNGAANGNSSDSTNLNSTQTFFVGGHSTSGAGERNVKEFRFSKIARWTANFTPPLMPYGL